MKVLIACESSGIVRDAFAKLGHDAWSLDILPSERPGNHIQGDLKSQFENFWAWDLVIAHPPCTYLTVTGNKWMKPEFSKRFPDRKLQRLEAINFFKLIAGMRCHKIAIENPVGIMSTEWRKPDQYIHPYMFGDPHSKKTGLWLKGLPLLKPTKIVEPQFHIYKDGRRDPLWHYETMRLPKQQRMIERSRTFQGIADAMAQQWGDQLEHELAHEIDMGSQASMMCEKFKRDLATVREEKAAAAKAVEELLERIDASNRPIVSLPIGHSFRVQVIDPPCLVCGGQHGNLPCPGMTPMGDNKGE